MTREKGGLVRVLADGRKGGGRILIQTESVYTYHLYKIDDNNVKILFIIEVKFETFGTHVQ